MVDQQFMEVRVGADDRQELNALREREIVVGGTELDLRAKELIELLVGPRTAVRESVLGWEAGDGR